MARIREGKGRARTELRKEGILIAGQYKTHQAIARSLLIPVPLAGELVSFRVVKAEARHGARPRVLLAGEEWVLADSSDPSAAAPYLPRHTDKEN